MNLKGTGVALITPFTKENEVDYTALTKLVNKVIEGGVNYLVVLGTTGESVTLTKDEKKKVVAKVKEVNAGRLPIMLGIGGNNTAEIVHEIETTDYTGISSILSVSPAYNRPSQEGIYQHYAAIVKASPLPVILYNVPARTGSSVAIETSLRLAKDFKNIIAIKEAAGDMVQAMHLLKNKPKDFLVLSGDDMIALPMVLAGGSGVISVIGQGFPKEFSEMIRLGLNRKVDDAFKTHYLLSDSIDMIFEQGNPAGIKQVFHSLGIAENTVRLPLVKVDDSLVSRIDQFVNKMDKLA